MQVTGSHNPSDYNGFKLCLGTRGAARRADPGRCGVGSRAGAFRAAAPGTIETRPSSPVYQDHVVAQRGQLGRADRRRGRRRQRHRRARSRPPLYERLGAQVTPLFCDPGRALPEPPSRSRPCVENMQQLDRARARDGRRARHRLRRRRRSHRRRGRRRPHRLGRRAAGRCSRATCWRGTRAPTIVSEVKCSQRLYDDIARHGGRGIMWKAGHSLLKAKMRETGALLGGEMSGHIFFKERWFGFDDAHLRRRPAARDPRPHRQDVRELLADLPPRADHARRSAIDCPTTIEVPRRRPRPRSTARRGPRADRRRRRPRPLPARLGPAARVEHAARRW